MKSALNKIKNWYKSVIKRLNNFRLTALIAAVSSAVAGLTSLGITFCYHFAGDVWERTNAHVPSFMNLGVDTSEYNLINPTYGKIMGMVFFLSLVIVIGLSIAGAYNLLPNIKNGEKVSVRKNFLLFNVISGVFQIVVLVFSILAITKEHPNTFGGYIATIPFTVITLLVNILLIVPYLKCVFYQPAVGSKLIQKKPKAEAPKEAVESK